MQLVIVRHGETDANLGRVIQGHAQNSLSERGKRQAVSLAERLLSESINVAYSSDLVRAKETAAAISQVICVPIEYTVSLRERSYGEFEGRSFTEYEQSLKASGFPRHTFQPSQGESLTQLEVRVSEFLDMIIAKHEGRVVLVVAHAGTIRMLLKLLLKKSFDEWLSIEQDNACVNIIEISREKEVTPHLLNCTSHLCSIGVSTLGVYE